MLYILPDPYAVIYDTEAQITAAIADLDTAIDSATGVNYGAAVIATDEIV